MQSIVVAYDGSEPARRALVKAGDLAAGGARLTVVSVAPVLRPAAGRSTGAVDPDEVSEHGRELAEARDLLAGRGLAAEILEAVGDPPEAIIDAAATVGADLIVCGTRGQSVSKRLLLGSVSTAIVHRAPCDVLVVR